MKFNSRVEIDAPAEAVFGHLSDFAFFDQLARRRSVSVRRVDTLTTPGEGMVWDVDFLFRGRMRHVETTLTSFVPPEELVYVGLSSGFRLEQSLQIVALAKARTRLQIGVEAKPRTLGARLLLQSARLGKAALDRRFDESIRSFGKHIESRLRD